MMHAVFWADEYTEGMDGPYADIEKAKSKYRLRKADPRYGIVKLLKLTEEPAEKVHYIARVNVRLKIGEQGLETVENWHRMFDDRADAEKWLSHINSAYSEIIELTEDEARQWRKYIYGVNNNV